MNTRERFQAIMRFQPFDRLPVIEWAGWWKKTLERWHGEGLPPDTEDRYDICRHFGLDLYWQGRPVPIDRECPRPACHGAGIMADEDDYERLLPHLFPDDVIDEAEWRAWAERQQRGEAVLWFSLDGFFWFPRRLFGIERHLTAFYDQPDLMRRMNDDLTEWTLGVLDRISNVCVPDFMCFSEDLSYNHGPMLSKPLFDEFLSPYYNRIVPVLKERGILTFVDSDGDVHLAARWFEEVGIEGVLPLERQAGVDIARLRADHPAMRFIGHFDKMTMNRGVAPMRAEFERLLPTAAAGGFLIGCDHQTPPGVSYQDYQTYLDLFREYAEEAGRRSRA